LAPFNLNEMARFGQNDTISYTVQKKKKKEKRKKPKTVSF
jgi:hypothetical protein